MPANKPVYIISDAPAETSVSFDFDTYARTISDLIANKENRTPLVIGIYGSWGSGKTTLMKTVQRNLKKNDYSNPELYRKCKTVWFQAWKYVEEEAILAALIGEIFKTMKRDGFIESSKAGIEKLINELKPFKFSGKLFETFTGINFAECFSDLEYKSKLGFYDTFQEFFDRLLWTYINLRPKLTSNEEPNDQKGALVIFIDDLDRCPQDRVIKVLETIKLFMDKRGCVFVIGAANDVIESALALRYGQKDAGRFMDKVVQVTFNLPQIIEDDFKTFIKNISPNVYDAVLPHLSVLIASMRKNPRQLKRFLNNLSLQAGILQNKKLQIESNALIYWNIFEYMYPALSGEIKEDSPNILFSLKEHIASVEEKLGGKTLRDISDEDLKSVPRSLHGYMRDSRLTEIVKSFSGDRETVKQLITLSGIVGSPEEAETKKAAKEITGFDDMVEIPAGEFLYGEHNNKQKIDQAFMIDVYPATNDQYEKFIKAGGYTNDKYWSKEGLLWKKKEKIVRPEYWEDPNWNQPGYPVIGVSYYEAEAYAKWSGKRLPTEIEWERAARGTDGRKYPWGNEFDKEKCNTSEAGIGKTTRVTRYPNGVSPSGCYDMAGNVWEWTSNDNYKSGKALRGGSWSSIQDYAHSATRYRYDPNKRNDHIGFRCVRT